MYSIHCDNQGTVLIDHTAQKGPNHQVTTMLTTSNNVHWSIHYATLYFYRKCGIITFFLYHSWYNAQVKCTGQYTNGPSQM